MNDNRRFSAKSKNDSINDFPLFQYNTSIIDLKIFPKDQQEEENIWNEYDRIIVNGVSHRFNDINDNLLDDLNLSAYPG